MAAMEKLVIGLEFNSVPDLNDTLQSARDEHFDFVTVPLVHPRLTRGEDGGASDLREAPMTRSDLLLPSSTWTTCVVGKLSPWLNPDGACPRARRAAERALKAELAWASHLSVPAVLCPPPRSARCPNYARLLHQAVRASSYLQLWVRLPLMSVREMQDGLPEGQESGQWRKWHGLRAACNSPQALSLALELTADLPSDEELLRWLGEPVRAVVVPTSVFLTNKKGYPTLSRRHQSFVKALVKHKLQFILRGRAQHAKGYLPYLQYLDHLRGQLPPVPEDEKFSLPYNDYLQVPLQPLADNLESATYETFEKDPVKYRRYEEAVAAALRDLRPPAAAVGTAPAAAAGAADGDGGGDPPVTLMVVGAGRGPLVRASLRAGEIAGRRLRVFAVEKNPNAVITLRNMKKSERWDNVTIIASDMREWKTDERADIMVSELLGSFGDNELSPECLDGAQDFLKPDGISIPQDYVSFVAPITSSKLWNEVRNFNDAKKFEMAYVVKMHCFYQIAEAEPCFKFEHPNWTPKPQVDNRRFETIEFKTKIDSALYGFAGYFESKLYKDIYISIVPQTFSDGMFSWFPLYFPLISPILVPKGEIISVSFWRCVSPTKVWYEWGLNSPCISEIHNANGHSYWIGL